MVEPTVGRIVHYWPSADDINRDGMAALDLDQPFAAIVVRVVGFNIVNLVIADHVGNLRSRQNVGMHRADDPRPAQGSGFWEWPSIKPTAVAA